LVCGKGNQHRGDSISHGQLGEHRPTSIPRGRQS